MHERLAEMSGRWMGDGGRCYLTSYLLLTCSYYLLRATYYLLLTTQAREMLSHNRDEATYLKLQARPPRPATQHRLQPYVLQAATLCGGGCNPMPPRWIASRRRTGCCEGSNGMASVTR